MGFEMEADPRHGELIVEALNLKETKRVATAGVDEPEDENDETLTGQDVFTYGSLAAREKDLAIDRPDLMFACKELCRNMSTPTQQAWRRLIRLGKYLKNHPRVVWHYHWQEPVKDLVMHSDVNCAGCHATRNPRQAASQ